MRDIETVGVLGAGTMGGGIAMNFANVGIPVTIVERNQEALDQGLAVIRKNYERTAKRGGIPAGGRREADGADHADPRPTSDLADCDLVIEAVFEDMDVKKDDLQGARRDLPSRARSSPPTPRRSTSNEIAAVTTRPET